MKDVNINKIEKMAFIAFKNAINLHLASISLFKRKFYPYAGYLSIISFEEVGKTECLLDFVFHSTVDGRYNRFEDPELTKLLGTTDYEEGFLRMIYDHRYKQRQYVRMTGMDHDHFMNSNFGRKYKIPKIITMCINGEVEKFKQGCIYVGLPKIKKRLVKEGRIIDPSKISRKNAQKQITTAHNILVEYVLGVYAGYHIVESEQLVKYTDRNLLNKLVSSWKVTDRRTISRLRKHFVNKRRPRDIY